MRRIVLLVLFLLVLALFFIVAGCQPAEEEAPTGPEILSVTAVELVQDISDLDADAVVVNVWATWCGPCRAEFPEFVRYGQDKADEGIAVRFLSVDDPTVMDRVELFLDQHGVVGPTYFSSEGADIATQLAAPNPWAYGIPVTFIYDGDGTLRAYWEGASTYDFLDAKVRQVLAESSSALAITG